MKRTALVLAVVASVSAGAHPEGFHAKYAFTVFKKSLRGLLVLDVDSGARCELIRAGADRNHDGVLDRGELGTLKERLTGFVTRELQAAISSYPLKLEIRDTKVSLRQDQRVSQSGLSIALLVEAAFPEEVSPGMYFELIAATPDRSHLRLEVAQSGVRGSEQEPTLQEDVPSGRKTRVLLGALSEALNDSR